MNTSIRILLVAFVVFYFRCYILNLIIGNEQYAVLEEPNRQNISENLIKRQHFYKNTLLNFFNYHETKISSKEIGSLKLGKDIFSNEDFEFGHNALYEKDLQDKISVQEFFKWLVISKYIGYMYNDFTIHRYDDYNELKKSGGPHVNQELCLKQLNNLVDRVDKLNDEKFNSKDLNLYKILDSFGRQPSNQLKANILWLGSYDECKNSKILIEEKNNNDLTRFKHFDDRRYIETKSRYCLAKLKLKSWRFKSNSFANLVGIKSAVCIPSACDSIKYKNKYALIKRLIDFNSRDFDKGQASIEALYCLPDEESPIRDWRKSKTVIAIITLTSLWFVLLIFATIKHDDSNSNENKQENEQENSLNLDNNKKESYFKTKIYKALSIKKNFKAMINVEPKVFEPIDIAEKGEEKLIIDKPIINLNILDGIKVLSLFYVVIAHVLMCLTTILENGLDMGDNWSIPYHATNMTPNFSVNSFFVVTGILTAYLMLRANLKHKLLLEPKSWLLIIIHRYVRIMPMYLLVVLYTKALAKYASSGPLWDYATSSMSKRKICEQESWLMTLLFRANTENPVEQCIPSGWYLANDFKFLLATPIFLITLNRSQRIGKLMIKIIIVICTILSFLNLYSNPLEDFRPIAQFDPHAFKTYITFFYINYVSFEYRLPAYLVGILIGYVLYKFEQDKILYLRVKKFKTNLSEKQNQTETDSLLLDNINLKKPTHSNFLQKYLMILFLFPICFCFISPKLAAILPRFSKPVARFLVALYSPAYHLLFSTWFGCYILLSSTGFGNKSMDKFLSSSYWRPFSRISLCAVLLNVEVINYIIQSSTTMWNIHGTSHFCLNLICLTFVYLVSGIVYVLFEAPIRGLLSVLLDRLIKKIASKQSKND